MRVLLLGASGMVGQGVLRECLLDDEVSEVLALVRSPAVPPHPKLREIVHPNLEDLDAIAPELLGIDACFFCLGTSSAGMSEADYAKVTYDLTLAVARTLEASAARTTFVYVSGAGTDAAGSRMWARVKGRTEDALLAMPFRASYMFRPALIHPAHGERSRSRWVRVVYALLGPLYPVLARLAPRWITTTERLGRAMLHVAKYGAVERVLENETIDRLGARESRTSLP